MVGCFLNPFSEYQLYSYARDGEIRLWDTHDYDCVRVMKIEQCIDFHQVIAHPTEPDVVFTAIIYKMENSELWM